MRRAKIVCTLGPASDGVETIEDLITAGMSVARLNASHGSTDHRAVVIDRVRDAAERLGEPVATMVDVSGPEIRTAPLDEPIDLEAGETRRFVEGETVTSEIIGLSTSVAATEPGDRILLDDGRIETTVTAVDNGSVTVQIESGGKLAGRKGVNVPGVDLELEMVTETDRQELELAARKQVEYVAASFVGSADDVYAIDTALESSGADIPLIAKIERAEAVSNLEGILEAAEGVMVARGDLGVECPLERVPLIQKQIIRNAQRAGVPVITATEMLDSMIESRRPTRAETSDVANAILDGTDAVMLSGETAVGNHPARVVETMNRIVSDVEQSQQYAESQENRVPPAGEPRTDAIARSARYLARDVDAKAIVTVTESGYTAQKVSKYRPAVPVVGVTPDKQVRRRLALTWGVSPRYQPSPTGGISDLIDQSATAAINAGVIESGDTIVVLAGMMADLEGANTTNMLKVHIAADILGSGRGVRSGQAEGPVFVSDDGELAGCPEGAIISVPSEFEGEFAGTLSKIAGIVSTDHGTTSYPAVVARELEVPMVSGIEQSLPQDHPVVVDGERGVVYRE